MKVSFKIKEDVICKEVEYIYINETSNRVVLHFASDTDVAILLHLSYKYKLEFYRYADDNHIGITIPMESIFKLQYKEA